MSVTASVQCLDCRLEAPPVGDVIEVFQMERVAVTA